MPLSKYIERITDPKIRKSGLESLAVDMKVDGLKRSWTKAQMRDYLLSKANDPNPFNKRGRTPGIVLDKPVILWNRYNCMWYHTIKNGDKVIGSDYSVFKMIYDKKMDDYGAAKDTLFTKSLKGLKRYKYKSDLAAFIPFFLKVVHDDNNEALTGLYSAEDNKSSWYTDKKATFEHMDDSMEKMFMELSDKYDQKRLAEWAEKKYLALKISEKPPRKEKSQEVKIAEQIKDFAKQLQLFED